MRTVQHGRLPSKGWDTGPAGRAAAPTVRAVELLYPPPGRGIDDVGPAYADPGRRAVGERPWVLVNMVASVDGATAVQGRSGGLGGPGDRAIFRALRDLADVVLVGAGTVRAERYGAPRKAGQRIAVVTRSGNLDYASPLFASGAGLVVTAETSPELPVETVRAGAGEVDLAGALAALRQRHGATVVLCEGGPSLNGDLLAADAVDEWCVTLSPLAAGGDASRLARGPVAVDVPLELRHVLTEDGFLFCRYVRRSAEGGDASDLPR
jgi:riboflavin biosynthesis pyrimidine reductase